MPVKSRISRTPSPLNDASVDLSGASGAGGDGSVTKGEVQAPGANGVGRGEADKTRGRVLGKGKKASGGEVPPLAK